MFSVTRDQGHKATTTEGEREETLETYSDVIYNYVPAGGHKYLGMNKVDNFSRERN